MVNISGENILIIDDDCAVRQVTKEVLGDLYNIAEANGALEAYKYMASKKVDLVLLDYIMPNINGIETLKEIKKRHPNVIVIMLTAYASPDIMRSAINLGAHGFIIKPYDMDELRNHIAKSLKTKSE